MPGNLGRTLLGLGGSRLLGNENEEKRDSLAVIGSCSRMNKYRSNTINIQTNPEYTPDRGWSMCAKVFKLSAVFMNQKRSTLLNTYYFFSKKMGKQRILVGE
tara:strand:- start:19324 stop:19629 length:306 start_codon:yes stop_codon:yes gene_type:complete